MAESTRSSLLDIKVNFKLSVALVNRPATTPGGPTRINQKARQMKAKFKQVEFGTQSVEVIEGGYYDRYRMNPDLDDVAKDPAAGNIDYFRRIPKQMVASRVGQTWAPNFYYRTSSIQLLFLAPLERLRATLPAPLEPLRALPGHGLVALTFFSYSVCDNDPYDEVSIAIVIRRPGARGSHALELLDSMRRRSFVAHVLALPVSTEIARVRGVYGYQLPKWRTDIEVKIDSNVAASIQGPDGKADLVLAAALPSLQIATAQSRLGTTTMLHQVDGRWQQTRVQSNTLAYAQKLLPRDVRLSRNGGPLSQLLDGLGASRVLRLDVVKDAQIVLHLPAPVESLH